jgi:hypothetical protein
MEEGRKEGRKDGRKEGWKEGWKEVNLLCVRSLCTGLY